MPARFLCDCAIGLSARANTDGSLVRSARLARPLRNAAGVSVSSVALFASLAGAQCDPATLYGPVHLFPTSASGYGSVNAADLDGDGDADLVTGSAERLEVWINGGDGTYTRTAYPGRSGRTAIADLDGDGDMDVVAGGNESVGGFSEDILRVLLNDGTGVLNESQAGATIGIAGVALADLDGDGTHDIVISSYTVNVLGLYFNQGNGVFTSTGLFPDASLPTGISPVQPAAADLDGDGDIDLAVVNENTATVSVLLGNGDGTFAPKTDYATGAGPRGIALGDLDGDGDADMVATNSAGGTVSVLMNNGDGSFSPQTTYGVGNSPASVDLGDLDADGDTDMAVANGGSNTVSVLLNNGDGSFAPQVAFGNPESRALTIADLDGDGDADIAGVQEFALGVLFNRCDPFVPAITTPPEQTLANLGDPAQALTVVADNAGAFQWRFNGEPIVDGVNYSGTDTETLSVVPVLETEGFYDVVVSNLGGEATSAQALFAVANDCLADLNGDDLLDLADIVGFVESFTAGCPD
jgi:hypothetical protein